MMMMIDASLHHRDDLSLLSAMYGSHNSVDGAIVWLTHCLVYIPGVKGEGAASHQRRRKERSRGYIIRYYHSFSIIASSCLAISVGLISLRVL